jgi:uncharacterized membrane protein
MGQAFIPFPTALMGEFATNPLAVSVFGVVFALNTLLFIALHANILRRLAKPDLLAREAPRTIARSFIGFASYLAGAAAAWVNVYAAFGLYLVTPLFFITPVRPRTPTKPG